MGSDLKFSGRRGRRETGRAAPVFLLALLLFAGVALGCGGGSGEGARIDPEKGEDEATLNAALARELVLLDAYTRGRPLMRGGFRAVGRELRAEEQEYADAITKAIRGLGGRTEEPPAPLDLSEIRTPRELLELLQRLEDAALEGALEAAPRLNTDAPQTVNAWLAAGHGEHLALIRQALGED